MSSSMKRSYAHIIYVIIMICLIDNQSGFARVVTSSHLQILIAFCLSIVYRYLVTGDVMTIRIKSDDIVFYDFIVPWIVIMFYSVVIELIRGNPLSYIARSVMIVLYILVSYLLAYWSHKRFGAESIKLTFMACILSNTYVVMQLFIKSGLRNAVLEMLSLGSNSSSILEIHTLTYIFGFFLLYYFFSENEKKWSKVSISLLFVYLGMKRAVFLALFIALAVGIVLKKVDSKYRNLVIKISSVMVLIGIFAYLYIIRVGILEAIADSYNIKTMSRIKFWNYFRIYYEFSPSFWGRGISFCEKIMMMSARELNISYVTNLHNDILRLYISIGFVPMILYVWYFITVRTQHIHKAAAKESAYRYFVLAIYFIITMFFSNVGYGFSCNLIFMILVLNILSEGKLNKNKLK